MSCKLCFCHLLVKLEVSGQVIHSGLDRCGKSCRLRWINYLRPDIKRGNFAQDEEDLIIKLHALLGNRWSLIAGRLPGRTDNEVKNYWNSHIRKKLMRMGIDPNNHKLAQHLPNPQPPQQVMAVSLIANSSESKKNDTCVEPPSKSCGNYANEDGMSSTKASSCIEEETSKKMVELNLDLTIAMP